MFQIVKVSGDFGECIFGLFGRPDVSNNSSKVFLIVFVGTLFHHGEVVGTMGWVPSNVVEVVFGFCFLVAQTDEFIVDMLESGAVEGWWVGRSKVPFEERLLFTDGSLDAADFEAGLMKGRRERMKFVGMTAEFFGS